MKCLPLLKALFANGNILHDWHAEIIALGAFNPFPARRMSSVGLFGRLGEIRYLEVEGRK